MLKNHMSTCKKTHVNMQHLFLMFIHCVQSNSIQSSPPESLLVLIFWHWQLLLCLLVSHGRPQFADNRRARAVVAGHRRESAWCYRFRKYPAPRAH